MKSTTLFSALAVALVAAGCASTGGLAPQAKVDKPAQLAAQRSLADTHVSDAAWPTRDWWKQFDDPQLDQLMDEALAGSPSLRLAAARTRKALGLAAATGAALVPNVTGSGSSTRERFTDNGLTPPPFGGQWATVNDLQATLNWEIDFWGKNRAAYESALGEAKAAQVDADAAQLALSTNVALAYVQLARAYAQLDVSQALLKERESVYALTRERNAAGIDTRMEVKQAEAALPATREQIAQLDETIAVTRNQLAALLGQGPDRGLAIARPALRAARSIELPSALPAELLGRRPDIVAQRQRIEAARQGIAAARAQFYPNINLTAFVGWQAIAPANLLAAASRTLGAGPAFTLPIFEGGQLRGNLASKNADYDIAVEQYNQTLADAMREVVDELAAWRSVDERRAQQKQALAAAQEAYDLALLRYREGIGNYLQVLSAEAPLLAQQSLDVDMQARAQSIAINLTRALGGGFISHGTPVAAAAQR
jgi:NodT family efflux transporter outer membrane factor (OMF) lipoprotein